MEPEHQVYKEHNIELRVRDAGDVRALGVGQGSEFELLIDNEPVEYGQLPSGQYVLRGYAYDPRDNLMALVRAFIDSQEISEKILGETGPKED